MKAANPALVLITLAICTASGCGTRQNVGGCCSDGPHAIYGGVAISAIEAWECLTKAAKCDSPVCLLYPIGSAYLVGVDIPLSLVGDTVTLPLTVLRTLLDIGEKAKRDRSPAQTSVAHSDVEKVAPEIVNHP